MPPEAKQSVNMKESILAKQIIDNRSNYMNIICYVVIRTTKKSRKICGGKSGIFSVIYQVIHEDEESSENILISLRMRDGFLEEKHLGGSRYICKNQSNGKR